MELGGREWLERDFEAAVDHVLVALDHVEVVEVLVVGSAVEFFDCGLVDGLLVLPVRVLNRVFFELAVNLVLAFLA